MLTLINVLLSKGVQPRSDWFVFNRTSCSLPPQTASAIHAMSSCLLYIKLKGGRCQ
jgi:hypothetical protein